MRFACWITKAKDTHSEYVIHTTLPRQQLLREIKSVLYYMYITSLVLSRDSSVGIATRYGLDGPGIESRWGGEVFRQSRPALRPTKPPIKRISDLSRG